MSRPYILVSLLISSITLAACGPEHVSCYQLTYAESTPLGCDLAAGRVRRLPNESEYELFVAVHRRMARLGYPAYEVSNFSQGDVHRSRHNSNYWRHIPYLGLGPSAHSFEPPVRMWNAASTSEYIGAVERGERPEAGRETLSTSQMIDEAVLLALRTTDGLDLAGYRERFGSDFVSGRRAAVERALDGGLLVRSDGRLRPTLNGLATADALAADLLAKGGAK